jgi:hypothetical protein
MKTILRCLRSACAAFVTRHSELGTETAGVASVDVEPAAATTADAQALLLDRLDEPAAKQDEIRAMLIELQRPATGDRRPTTDTRLCDAAQHVGLS